MILEKQERLALVSLEITSLMDDVVEELKELVSETAGVEKKNIWIMATHTFSAPHLLGGPMLLHAGESEKEKDQLYRKALSDAVKESVETAVRQRKEAYLSSGRGECGVNVYRDISSRDGWWIGMDPDGPADHTLRVYCVKDPEGSILAVLYHYGVQSSIMDQVFSENGEREVTSDLFGEASREAEKALGNGAVVMSLLGPCGDQVPKQRARYWTTDAQGRLQEVNLGPQAGYGMIAELGGELAGEIRNVLEKDLQDVEHPQLRVENRTIQCPRQKKQFEGFPVPTKDYRSIPDGVMETELSFLHLSPDHVLVGVKPEINCVTAQEIRRNSSKKDACLVQMVNGAQKYLADRLSFERGTYEAMNGFFGCGAAEVLAKEVEAILSES